MAAITQLITYEILHIPCLGVRKKDRVQIQLELDYICYIIWYHINIYCVH